MKIANRCSENIRLKTDSDNLACKFGSFKNRNKLVFAGLRVKTGLP